MNDNLMQLILVQFFFWDELVKNINNREQTRQSKANSRHWGQRTLGQRIQQRILNPKTHLKKLDSYKLTQRKLR